MASQGPGNDHHWDAIEGLVRLGERRLTWPEVCEQAGVEHEVADRLWRALGFPDVPEDERAYSDDDVRALAIAGQGMDELEGDDREAAIDFAVREARTVSAHLAHIVEVQVDAFAELGALGLREHAVREAFEHGLEASDLGWLLFYGLRRRLDEALRRRAEVGDQPSQAIGFIDLVDFTRRSSHLEADEFIRLISRFEALAADIVTEAGGRVVKLIGDEAMFACPDPTEAGLAALEVVARSPASDLPEARDGLAYGSLLLRGGDYFGPAVNLASRLVDLAEPARRPRRAGERHRRPTPQRGPRRGWADSHRGAWRGAGEGIGEVQLRRLIRCVQSFRH